MNSASASLHSGISALELIDSGNFSESQSSLKDTKKAQGFDQIAAAEVALYFGRISDAAEVLKLINITGNDISLAARAALAEGELLYAQMDFSLAQKRFNAAYYFSEFLKDYFSAALATYRNSRILSARGQQDEAIALLHQAYENLRGQVPEQIFCADL